VDSYKRMAKPIERAPITSRWRVFSLASAPGGTGARHRRTWQEHGDGAGGNSSTDMSHGS